MVNGYMGLAYFSQGVYHQAIGRCRQAIALLEDNLLHQRFGHVIFPASLSRNFLSNCYDEVGAFAESIAVGKEGLQIAETVKHPLSLIASYYSLGKTYCRKGDLHQALPLLERS